ISLNNNWQEYSFTVKAPEDNELEARLSVSLADQVGAVWLDQLRMEEASIVGLEDGEELSAGNIRRIHWSDRLFHTPQRIADQAEFYFSIQKGYFDDMYQFLRDRLGVQVPITGTNAITGHGEAMSMQNMDFVDDHAYWNHPLFPSIPWSSYDWLIDNEPMVKSEFLGTIPGLFAGLAARGKPYTISEYNHPFPNHFQTELFAILTAYASLHDADALMLYSYNESHQNWEADWINGFFNIHRNNAMMGLFPIYSYAFRQKLLTADPDPILIDYPEDYVYQLSVDDNTGPWTAFHPYESGIGLQRAIRTQGYAAEEVPDFSDLPSTPGRVFETAGEETRVNTNEGIVASTGEQFIGICGFLDQANGQQFGPLQLQSANSFGTLSWLSLDEQPLPQSQRSVIALSSRIQNEGMVWDGDQTVHDQWGTSPTSIFPLQIALRLQIDAPAIQVHPLDATGAASTYRTYLPNDEGIFDILLDQREDKTLWFGIETTQLTNVQSVSATTFDMRIHPNPTGALLHLSAQLPKGHRQAEWIISNSMGQTVRRRNVDKRLTHLQRQSLSVDDLPAGMYLVRLRVDGQEASLPLVIQR
ncbi:MAG: T9SS type A sorting domain-containing protein, partial [Bacteroidota bacterium]